VAKHLNKNYWKRKPMTQTKVSIPDDEWQKVVNYFNRHEKKLRADGIRSPTALLQKKLRADGIRSPTALLRFWIREGMKTQRKSVG